MAFSPYQFSVTDEAGNVMPEASITVTSELSAALPQLYANKAGTEALGNPFDADENGYALFFVTPGEYRIDAVLGAQTATPRRYVSIGSGERYDIPYAASGPFGASEELPAIAIVLALTLPAGLPGSLFFVDTAPTSSAVFTFQKKTGAAAWATVFTVTFAAGQTSGTVTLAADATLAVGDRLRAVCPGSVDATLEGLSATVAALRQS